MYEILLFFHSWLRWIVLLLALVVIFQSIMGVNNKLVYQQKDNICAASFVGTIYLMILMGLGLYFLSPYAYQAFGGSESIMKNATLRFWAVEHTFVMLIAGIIAIIGRIKSKKAPIDYAKFKIQLIFFSIALLLMLSRIPWSETGRLLRCVAMDNK